jgi:hypothetical protein
MISDIIVISDIGIKFSSAIQYCTVIQSDPSISKLQSVAVVGLRKEYPLPPPPPGPLSLPTSTVG